MDARTRPASRIRLSRSQEQKPRLCQRGSLAGDFEGIGLEPKDTSARRMGGRVAREEENMKRASNQITVNVQPVR